MNTVLGERAGPVGVAWATALATPSAGHTPFVAVVIPGIPVKPMTLFVNKAPIAGDEHGTLTWLDAGEVGALGLGRLRHHGVVAIVIHRILLGGTKSIGQVEQQDGAAAAQSRHRAVHLEAILLGQEAVLERHMRAGLLGFEAQRLWALPGIYQDPRRVRARLEIPIVERDGVAARKDQAVAQKRVARSHELRRLAGIARSKRLVLHQLCGDETGAL